MAKLIVVTGVTGVQGSSVAETFLREPGWKVRGVTRNSSGDTARKLADQGVEMVQADLDDTKTLIPAFEDATVIFSNTDYFMHFFAAISSKQLAGSHSNMEYAFDREVEQGLNIAEAAAAPTTIKTLERFVFSALPDPQKLSHGKYSNVYHYQSKAKVIEETQIRFPEVAARMSTVHVGHYVNNWKMFRPMAPRKQADGTYELQSAFSPSYLNGFVVAHRDTGEFVKALVDLPAGTNLQGISEWMTWPEYARLWGKTLGIETSFKQISTDELFREAPEFQEEMEPAFNFVEEFGTMGEDPTILDQEKLGVKIPVTSLEEYIKSEDWTSIL